MVNQRYKVGPGSLVFGEVGSEEEFEAQITEALVEWDVDANDDEEVLSGEVIPGEETFTAKISGSLYQDIKASGIVRWSWTERGTVVPFTYIPNTVEDTQVTGEIKVRPLSVGGVVGEWGKSDFEFPCVGEPSIANVP